jgi:hypothetical protein
VPWEPALTEAPEAWLDWVLRMNTKYPKGSQKFIDRVAEEEDMAFTKSAVGWAGVLTGSALADFMGKWVPDKLRSALARSGG